MENEYFITTTNNVCRTCLTPTAELTSLFTMISLSNRTEPLASILSTCTQIEVLETDTLPQNICSPCLGRLTQSYSFLEICHESQDKLKQLYACEQDFRQELPPDGTEDICEEVLDLEQETTTAAVVECETKHACPDCGKTFFTKYTLNRHRKIHVDAGGSLKCEICSKQFSRMSDVKRHMHTHTGEKPYPCVMCDSAFNQSGILALHMRRAHDVKPTVKSKEKKSHMCSMCGKCMNDSSSLTLHIRRHVGHKPYCCQVCGMRFVSGSRLTSHKRVHTGERPFTCKICGKSFAQSSVIGKHLRTHSGVRPYGCDVCAKRFTTLYYLKIHQRLHTGEKPHECGVCKKVFSDPKNLKRHQMIHLDQKPYMCVVCGKLFRRNHHLKTHMNIHSVK